MNIKEKEQIELLSKVIGRRINHENDSYIATRIWDGCCTYLSANRRKPPVIHVFSATLSISIFVPQNEAYDDTRRSCRNYYVLQGTQSNL